MHEVRRQDVAAGAWTLFLLVVLAVATALFARDLVPLATTWWRDVSWTWRDVCAGLLGAAAALWLAVHLAQGVAYLGIALRAVGRWLVGAPRGRAVVLALAALGVAGASLGAWLAQGTSAPPPLGLAAFAVASVLLLGIWGRGPRARSAGQILGTLVVPAVLCLLLLAEGTGLVLRDAHLWTARPSLPALQASLRHERPEAPRTAPAPAHDAGGRLALVIARHFTDLPLYVYVDGRVVAERRYAHAARVHATNLGAMFYATDGDLLYRRQGGRFVYLPDAPPPPQHGLRYAPPDPRMGDPRLFEHLFVDVPAGRHLVEFVSVAREYEQSPASPFVRWSSEEVDAEDGKVVTVVAFEGTNSPAELALGPVARAEPYLDAEEKRVAYLEQRVAEFAGRWASDPLVQALAQAPTRAPATEPWILDLPAAYGGRREYTGSELVAMGDWLLSKARREEPR